VNTNIYTHTFLWQLNDGQTNSDQWLITELNSIYIHNNDYLNEFVQKKKKNVI